MPGRSRTGPTTAKATRSSTRGAAPPGGEAVPAKTGRKGANGNRGSGGARTKGKGRASNPEELGHAGGAGDDGSDGEEAEVEAALNSDALDEDEDEDEEPAGPKRKRASVSEARKKRRRVSDRSYRYKHEEDGSEPSLDSDALDDDDDVGVKRKKRASVAKAAPKKSSPEKKASPKKASPRKKRNQEESEDEDDGLDLKDGQEVVGVVVQAPKKGRVPPGQISKNTLNFLSELKKPECNDREWFKLHEPVYRLAEKEWKDFVDAFTPLLVEVDTQIPHLPPKDVIHRIYRDVRFSNDKTPYKTGLSASFSRSGRKGIFAHYHIAIIPGGESLIAAGAWQPGKNELATIRNNILRSPRRLRNIISEPEFVRYFGEARPDAKGGRSNIFGREDELKNAPKGVAKDHPDIDLLKCRSLAVVHHFLDSEVVAPDFKEALCKVVKIVKPFVHCLNDMMSIQDGDSSDDNDDGEEGDEGGDDDE